MAENEIRSRARRSLRAGLALLPVLFLAVSVRLSATATSLRAEIAGDASRAGSRDGLLLEVSHRPWLAFGFRNFAADLAWLKAVQVAGTNRLSPAESDRLDRLVGAVIRLDERFKIPYLLGGLLLGESPGRAERAIELLRMGGARFPDDWQFPYYEGYTWYFILGRSLEGGRAFQRVALIPDSPPYASLLATRMLSEANDPETALALLAGILREETDPARIEVLERRAREVVFERDARMLERAAGIYRQRSGTYPPRLEALVEAGILRRLPEEPNGGRYRISRDGSVSSDRTGRLKVFKAK